MIPLVVKQATPVDLPWMNKLFQLRWGGDFMVTRGKTYYLKELLGLIVYKKNKKMGLLTYRDDHDSFEIMSLDSVIEHQGVGTKLIHTLVHFAKGRKKQKVWLITTNNNTHAQQFYERRGFKKIHVYKDAVSLSRKIKPSIPFVDENGTPVQDEIEYEYQL